MIEVAIHNGSPGLANRIKNYVSILRTFKQALTTKDADAYIFDDIRVATDEELNTFPCYDNWRLATVPGEDKYKTEYKHIDLLYDKTPEHFVEAYISHNPDQECIADHMLAVQIQPDFE